MALYTGCSATSKIPGSGLTTQNLFAFQNGVRSKRLVRIRRLSTQLDSVNASGNPAKPPIKTTRLTGTISGGVEVPKGTFDTNQVSDPEVRLSQYDSPDGVLGAPLEATPGGIHWQDYATKMLDLTGQVLGADADQLPRLVQSKEFILYPGEFLLVHIAGTGATLQSNLYQWFIQCVWTEDLLATFTVSGVVTLNATPVVGAEVLVVIADDNNMTNAQFWELVTTTAGGAWSSNIPVGKVAFAFAQDDQSGTLYTSEGRPYLKQ